MVWKRLRGLSSYVQRIEVHIVNCVCTKESAMFAIWPRLRHLEKHIILTIDGIETLVLHLGFNLVRNINEMEIMYQT